MDDLSVSNNSEVVLIKPGQGSFYCFDREYYSGTLGGLPVLYIELFIDILLTISILIVNSFAILAIILYRKSYKGSSRIYNSKASMRFVLNLAISDILVPIGVLFYLFPHYLCDVNELYRSYKFLCLAKFVPSCFASVMSNMSLIGIAVDRYIAVVHCLKYRLIMTDRVCTIMLAAIVIFSLTSSGVLFFWNYWEEGTYCDFEDTLPQYYVMALGIACHGAILIIVSGIHYRLHQKASNVSKTNAKSAKTVGLVTGVYFLSWTPYSIVLMVKSMTKTTSPAFELIFQITFRISYANSLLNPFIYAWRNGEIRAAILWFIKKLSFKGSTLGKHTHTHNRYRE